MKINYDEIITKANERKEKLQKLTELLREQPAQVNALLAILGWATEVHRVHASLDTEGRSLLPKDLQRALLYTSSVVGSLSSAHDIGRADVLSGIAKWVGLED